MPSPHSRASLTSPPAIGAARDASAGRGGAEWDCPAAHPGGLGVPNARHALPEADSVTCPPAAPPGQLNLTACDRRGPRRVGRAAQGGTGLWCWAIACGGGPPPRVRTSCTGCTCALGYGATHGTEARACWGRRATGATLYRPWSVYATGTVPLSRPRPLGRHDAAGGRSPAARGRAVGIFQRGGNEDNIGCRKCRQTPIFMIPLSLHYLYPIPVSLSHRSLAPAKEQG